MSRIIQAVGFMQKCRTFGCRGQRMFVFFPNLKWTSRQDCPHYFPKPPHNEVKQAMTIAKNRYGVQMPGI